MYLIKKVQYTRFFRTKKLFYSLFTLKFSKLFPIKFILKFSNSLRILVFLVFFCFIMVFNLKLILFFYFINFTKNFF